MPEKLTREVMESLLDSKLHPIEMNMKELKETIDGVLGSMKFISEQYDDLLLKFTAINEEEKELRKENARLKDEVFKISNDLQLQKNNTNDLEQYSRRDCLEIRGIPIQEDENTDQLIINLGSMIGVKIADDDISTSHRLPTKRSTSITQSEGRRDPLIIVKFVKRNTREKLYQARKMLKEKSSHDLGFTGAPKNGIYINESLTQRNKALFGQCLQVKREQGFRFLWTRSGKIFLRLNETERIIHISCENDLEKLSARPTAR